MQEVKSNELTPQIAGMYFGCKVVTNQGGVYTTDGFLKFNSGYEFLVVESGGTIAFNNCKLILFPLGSISDEHLLLIRDVVLKGGSASLEVVRKFILEHSGFNLIDVAILINELRKLRYDMDSLLELGIAITPKSASDGK